MRVANGSVTLAVEAHGSPNDPPILFLHGFPEHRGAWRKVTTRLADDFHCLLPDLRGYGLSSRPEGVDAYAVEALLGDIDVLVDACGPARPILAGHDWGGFLAWYYAARHGDRIAGLAIANAPHPALFQRALIEDPAQRAASAYIARLRAPGAAAVLLDGGPEGLWDRMYAANPVFGAQDRKEYIAAWSHPGAMEAMLNWYRAAPFILPEDDTAAMPGWVDAKDLRVDVPVLILWGMADAVFVPALLDGLETVAPGHRIERFDGVGHGIIHEIPESLAASIREFATS